MHKQVWGYKVEKKLHQGVREQKKKLNATELDNQLTDGGEVVSLTHGPRSIPRKRSQSQFKQKKKRYIQKTFCIVHFRFFYFSHLVREKKQKLKHTKLYICPLACLDMKLDLLQYGMNIK
jgi:hypothetical protein